MRYMLLIYTKGDPTANRSEQEMEELIATHWPVMNEAERRGIFRGAEPLHPASTAVTLRMQNGKPLITDGPFAETKEQLAGYYILDCKDLDEAVEFADKIPRTCIGPEGCIEIRPIRPMRARPQPAETISEYIDALKV